MNELSDREWRMIRLAQRFMNCFADCESYRFTPEHDRLFAIAKDGSAAVFYYLDWTYQWFPSVQAMEDEMRPDHLSRWKLDLADNIIKARGNQGMVQGLLAYTTGMSYGQISKIESTDAIPSALTIAKFARACDVTCESLIGHWCGTERILEDDEYTRRHLDILEGFYTDTEEGFMAETGRRIKELRMLSGYSQKEFGNVIEISRVSVNFYENAKHTISSFTVAKMAKAFGVTCDYLIGHWRGTEPFEF